MLKISVDATPIRETLSGIGMYTLNLITSLAELQAQEYFDLTIAFQPSLKKWLKADFSLPSSFVNLSQIPIYTLPLPVTIVHLLAKFPNPILSFSEKYLGSPDILHGTDHFVYPCRNSLRVMTIHDLTFIKYPEYTNTIVKTYTNRVKQCLQWTDLIITFAENTKNEIVDCLKVNPDKIYITPQASRYMKPLTTRSLPLGEGICQPYILFVSTLEPRKNINTLIKAFNILKQEYLIEHKLLLIGQKGWGYQPILSAIEASPVREEIYQLGYVSDELLALFYQKADVFVYPSYYEGFGLPVLEAMTLGAPVVTSNTSSLPEVASDAALLINPNDAEELADSIFKVISDRHLRQQLIDKGFQRAKLFSWEKTALLTLNAYKSIL